MTDDSYTENQEKKNIKLRKILCMPQYSPHSALGKETKNETNQILVENEI